MAGLSKAGLNFFTDLFTQAGKNADEVTEIMGKIGKSEKKAWSAFKDVYSKMDDKAIVDLQEGLSKRTDIAEFTSSKLGTSGMSDLADAAASSRNKVHQAATKERILKNKELPVGQRVYEGDLDGLSATTRITPDTPMQQTTPLTQSRKVNEARKGPTTYTDSDGTVFNHRADSRDVFLNTEERANRGIVRRTIDSISEGKSGVGGTTTARRREYNSTVNPNKGQEYITSNRQMKQMEHQYGRGNSADDIDIINANTANTMATSNENTFDGIPGWLKATGLVAAGAIAGSVLSDDN